MSRPSSRVRHSGRRAIPRARFVTPHCVLPARELCNTRALGKRMLLRAPRARHLVVVLEDEFLVRLATCAALAEAGFGVADTRHSDWALTYLRDHARDVSALVTDIHVPGSVDGLALAQLSRRTWPWISLVIVS